MNFNVFKISNILLERGSLDTAYFDDLGNEFSNKFQKILKIKNSL
jgi:hypothetical protein